MDTTQIYKPIYTEMRERNIRKLNESGVVIDPVLISGKADTRKGVGLFAFIESPVPALESLLSDVASSFPDQISYTLSPTPADRAGRIHFTFFQYIKVDSIPKGFSDEHMKKYAGITREVLHSMPQLTIAYKGVMAIPTGLLIYGYPSYDVNPYREQIRQRLLQENVPFVEPYKSDIVHSTVMRIAAFIDSDRLLAFVDKYANKVLFEMTVSKLHLGFGSWRMRSEEIEMVKTFNTC